MRLKFLSNTVVAGVEVNGEIKVLTGSLDEIFREAGKLLGIKY